ncbi:hypothetical protein [Desertibacillus haloalkaliphilus]|uniref:hypothetical protein n=1 Tax=Desertibacillus haloalkaliphilus TaxID=1328930 RepID=UPI001FE49413|nr:hypothetical protein [Desertibacillus haloalkaliphilus]
MLEHHIKEVKKVEPYEEEWTKDFDSEFVRVVVITNCHGCIEERESIERTEDWEKIKERGYFMW